MRLWTCALLGCSALTLAGCGSSGPVCDADELTSALEGADPGDTVEVGVCTIAGAFSVPSGVTLLGHGSGSVIMAAGGPSGLELLSGSGPSVVRDLVIDSSAQVGILAKASAQLSLEDVHVTSQTGVGIAIEDAASATLTRLVLEGIVGASYGVLALRVQSLNADHVAIRGFNQGGALVVDSTSTWTDSELSDELRLGLLLDGGRASLRTLSVLRISSEDPLLPAHALVAAGGAQLDAVGLTISDSHDVGLLLDHASADISGLEASNNPRGAVWAQAATALAIHDSVVSDGQFAGVIAIDSQSVSIKSSQIRRVSDFAIDPGDGSMIHAGDGIQLVNSARGARLENLDLERNSRVGVLIDLNGGTLEDMTFNGVRVSANSGSALGVWVQNGDKPAGWDSGVARDSLTTTHDAAFSGSLPSYGSSDPSWVPALDLRASGVAGAI